LLTASQDQPAGGESIGVAADGSAAGGSGRLNRER
jgi:hypothetical protein